MSTDKNKLYEEITNEIIELIEAGTIPWQKDWVGFDSAIPYNPFTKSHYHGINVLILWARAMKHNYTSNFWATYNQVKKAGGNIKKGSKGTKVVFYKPLTVKEKDRTSGEEEEKQIPILKSFTVFNMDQIENLEGFEPPVFEHHDNESIEIFIQNIGAKIVHEGARAFYDFKIDKITLPPKSTFKSIEGYYATSLHEHVHWTGHKKRLDRDFKPKYTLDKSYAFEELVAELGAAFCCSELNITYGIEKHASYLEHWLKMLKDDSKALFKAAAKATKAVEFFNNKQQ